MGNARESAEAFLIVIKRLAKWILFVVLGIAGLAAAIGAGAWSYNYVTYEIPKSGVEVSLMTKDDKGWSNKCAGTKYPVLLFIGNRSGKTILHTDVYVEARRNGHSTDLATYDSIKLDKIIKPDGGYTICTRPTLKGSALGCDSDYSYKNCKQKYEDVVGDLIWGIKNFSLRFE
jgi:hypothetical protein